jgi:uncharacterized membrane protein YesL
MNRLVGWHTTAGEIGLRLLKLHLLWLGWTLAGGVLLGVFPATAAVHAVIRRDLLRGDDDDRAALREEFRIFWRESFAGANVLGYVVTALWALLLLDRHLLSRVDMGGAAPALAGLLWVLTAVLFVMTASLGSLHAHFAEGPLSMLRRSAVLAVARPKHAIMNALAVGVVLCAYYVVPGLIPVFGVALPAYLSFAVLWRSGLLPAPRAVRAAPKVPATA